MTAIGENTFKVARTGTVKYNDLIGEVKRSTGRGLCDWLFQSGTSQGGQTTVVGTRNVTRETDDCLLSSSSPTLPPPQEPPPQWTPPWSSPNQSIYTKTMEESRKQRPKARWQSLLSNIRYHPSLSLPPWPPPWWTPPKSMHDADPLFHKSIPDSHITTIHLQ